MIELPVANKKPDETTIKSMLIVGHMKSGKTSNCLLIPDSVLIDLGGSGDYYGGTFFNVKKISAQLGKGPVNTLKEIVEVIRAKNKEVKGYFYKRIIIDELSTLEEMAIAYATFLYKRTAQGADYKGNDITELDYGRGYGLLRDAMDELINPFRDLCETLILIGHSKTSVIKKAGVDVQANDINLTGKLRISIPASTDANAVMYRDKSGDKNYLSFINRGNDVITGSRVSRLAGKEILISEVVDGKLVAYWDQIFNN